MHPRQILNTRLLALLLLALLLVGAAQSSASAQDAPQPTPGDRRADADVVAVRVEPGEDNRWDFHVTVRHPDTGWDDYADGWDVVLPDGTVVKVEEGRFTRVLGHPHQDEQPFTRSQTDLPIPADVPRVTVRAHDLVDGWGGKEMVVNIKRERWLAPMRTRIVSFTRGDSPWYWCVIVTLVALLGLWTVRAARRKRRANVAPSNSEPSDSDQADVDDLQVGKHQDP